jgi:hypothetical protein
MIMLHYTFTTAPACLAAEWPQYATADWHIDVPQVVKTLLLLVARPGSTQEPTPAARDYSLRGGHTVLKLRTMRQRGLR